MYILKQGTVEIIVSDGDNSMLFVFKELHSYWKTVAVVPVSILLIVILVPLILVFFCYYYICCYYVCYYMMGN